MPAISAERKIFASDFSWVFSVAKLRRDEQGANKNNWNAIQFKKCHCYPLEISLRIRQKSFLQKKFQLQLFIKFCLKIIIRIIFLYVKEISRKSARHTKNKERKTLFKHAIKKS